MYCTYRVNVHIYDEVKDKYEYPSVTKMVQELGWMPLYKRRQVTRLVNFLRVVNGQRGYSMVPGVSKECTVVEARGDHHFLKVERRSRSSRK
jgi:hypothetical protein